MPIYTYRCQKCLQEFEVQHEMSAYVKYHLQISKLVVIENEAAASVGDLLDIHKQCRVLKEGEEPEHLCNGELERAYHIPLNTTPYVPPTGKDLEYRIRQHFEDVNYELKKTMASPMNIDYEQLKEKKNGK